MSEIQSYLDRAQQDLQAAERILADGFYHVTVARAYYAMFYATQAILISQGIRRHRHAGVLSAFNEHFVKTGLIETEYAKKLSTAFNTRLGSDYDVMYSVEPSLAESVLQDAQQFVDRVEAYLRQVGNL
jgi:uncharacterized protein (UPF0332 family)